MMMGARKNGDSDRVDIFLKCRFNNLLWSTPEASINHLHTSVTKSPGDNKRPPIMPIQPRLGNQNTQGPRSAPAGSWRLATGS